MKTKIVFFQILLLSIKFLTAISINRGTPVIDGKLSDPAWESAPRCGEFTKLGTRDPSAVKTSFSLLYDEENLYVAVRCHQPTNTLVAKALGRDSSAVFADDSVEFFIDTLAASEDIQNIHFFQIAVSAGGAYFDVAKRKGDLGAIQEDPSWNPDIKVRTALENDHWTVEMCIPFSQLAFREPKPGFFSCNVTRNWQGVRPVEWSTWTPLSSKNFNLPREFQKLEGIAVDFTPYLWEVKNASLLRVEKSAVGLKASFQAEISHLSGKNTLVELTGRLTAPNGVAYDVPMHVPSSIGDIRMEFPFSIKSDGVYNFEIFGQDSKLKKDVFYFSKGKNRLFFSLLEVAVTNPHYRDSIYSDQKIDAIEGVIDVAIEDSRLRDFELALTFGGKGEKGFQNTIDAIAKKNPFSIPAVSLKEGTYELFVELIKKSDRSIAGAERKTIRKLPRREGEVRYDRDRNCMLVDAKPYLPIGWYGAGGSKSDYPYLTNTHFNQLYDSVAMWLGTKGTKAYLDEAHQHGLKLMTWIYPNDVIMKEKIKGLERPPQEVKLAIAEFITSVKDHPALLGWYMADEPEYNGLKPSCMEELYQLVRDTDPYHPTVMLNCTAAGIIDYKNGADILMPDPYPPFYKGQDVTHVDLGKVAEFVSLARTANAGRGPVWVTPEAFNYAEEITFQDRRFPTFLEERSMTALSLVHGATGFCYFSFPWHLNSPDLFVGMPHIAKELKELSPIILEGETVKATSSEKQVQVLCRKYRGNYFLIAVNTLGNGVRPAISIPDVPEAVWNVLAEDRRVAAKAGVIKDAFDGAATHLYTTDLSIKKWTPLAKIQEEIFDYEKSLWKKGNLAFKKTGATILTSHTTKIAPFAAESVLDGCVHPRSKGITFRGNTAPHWVELTLKKSAPVGQVVIFAMLPEFVWKPAQDYLFDYRLSYRNGESWTLLSEGVATNTSTTLTFPTVNTDRLRLDFPKNRGRIDLVELEVYENTK